VTRERGLLALVALPAAITFGLALFEYDLVQAPDFRGLGNFRELFDDEVFRISLRNSLLFIAFAVPIRLVGAVGLALLLHRRIRGVGAYRAGVYLPTIVPDVAYALLWLWMFNPLYGPINVALDGLGLPSPEWLTDGSDARWAIVTMTVFLLGEGFLVALATRQSLPGELYELAAVEAASPLYVFRRVTLPLMAPVLLLLLFRDTIFSFQVNFVPALLVTEGGPPPYETTYLPLFVYQTGFEYLRYGYAAAATVVMFLITALIVFIQWRIVVRWRRGFAV
jgi:multiple sugar transport system permease protein